MLEQVFLASDPDNVEMHYCTASVPNLPLGSYCTFQNALNGAAGWCPTGFSMGTRRFDTEDDSKYLSYPWCTSSSCYNMLPRCAY